MLETISSIIDNSNCDKFFLFTIDRKGDCNFLTKLSESLDYAEQCVVITLRNSQWRIVYLDEKKKQHDKFEGDNGHTIIIDPILAEVTGKPVMSLLKDAALISSKEFDATNVLDCFDSLYKDYILSKEGAG